MQLDAGIFWKIRGINDPDDMFKGFGVGEQLDGPAWNLMRGVHPDKVVRLMGHGSRQMIYEVYGRYVEGLEDDVDAIQAYLEGQTNECPHSGSGDIWGDIRPEEGANEL